MTLFDDDNYDVSLEQLAYYEGSVRRQRTHREKRQDRVFAYIFFIGCMFVGGMLLADHLMHVPLY